MSEKRIVLHAGCGPSYPSSLHPRFRGPEWQEVRLDVNPGVKPDIVASIADLSEVPSGSVDAVWCAHTLEHLVAHEVPPALAGFLRVLRPGGEAHITLPDLELAARLIAEGKLEETVYETPFGAIAPLDMVYGRRRFLAARGNEFMGHRTGFTAKTLERKLLDAGFAGVEVEHHGDFALWATARKPA